MSMMTKIKLIVNGVIKRVPLPYIYVLRALFPFSTRASRSICLKVVVVVIVVVVVVVLLLLVVMH